MPYTEIARAETERGELVLRQRRDDDAGPDALELRANGVFVMDTVEVGSERALASTALGLIERPDAVLIGGLGLGFTLREVMADPRVLTVSVVEIEQQLVDWMRDGTIPHGPELLADERISVVVADVAQALDEAGPSSFDLVLLDVDNGPDNLVHTHNAALYAAPALVRTRRVLRPGGVLVVWSAARSVDLETALADVFSETDAVPVAVRLQDRDEQYWLHLGRLTT